MLKGDQLSTRQLNFTSILLNTSEIILQLIRHQLISLLIEITSFTLTFSSDDVCNFRFELKWLHWHGLTKLSMTSNRVAIELQHKSNFAGDILATYTKAFAHVLDFASIGKLSRLSAV